jgi:hypothetical protein
MNRQPPSDAVRRHFIDALRQRAQAQPEPIRRILEGRLSQAVAEREAHLERAPTVALLAREAPPSPLADLLGHIERQTTQDAGDTAHDDSDRADLKSLRYFRDNWSKLGADQSVAQALATGPANAGPLNSHSLILQTLQRLRETSPDYLTRFMAYANALLWLDQANVSSAPPKKSGGRGEGNKKRKPTRT